MSAAEIQPDPSGVTETPATEARARLYELLDLVEDGQFVYLTRHGKRVAALMPADVAENYERIEDDYWARRAAEAERSEPVAWGRAIVELEGDTSR